MIFDHPWRVLGIATFLLLFGFVMPFLMALRVVESTLFLNFLSFGSSVLGLMLGLVGVSAVRARTKKKDDDHHNYD